MKHEYIKCDLNEYHMLRIKMKDQYDEDPFRNYVPNSIPRNPYKPHPQFTIKTDKGKITYFMVEK